MSEAQKNIPTVESMDFKMKSALMMWGEARGFVKFMSEDDFYKVVEKYCEMWDLAVASPEKKKEFMFQFGDKTINSQIGENYFLTLARHANDISVNRMNAAASSGALEIL